MQQLAKTEAQNPQVTADTVAQNSPGNGVDFQAGAVRKTDNDWRVEFDTLSEKMAFERGLRFEEIEQAAAICYAGHYDETRNENGKYEWELSVQPLKPLCSSLMC